jgi:uncharacterized protein YegP (UPF0339 family)
MAAKYEITHKKGGKFHFHLKAGNGEIILSSQMYTTKEHAEKGIASCKSHSAKDSNYVRKQSKKGQPFFELTSTNHEIIGMSEMYSSVEAREKGVRSVQRNGPDARVVDLTEKE